MKEYFYGLMQALGKVPTEFMAMNATQKLIISIFVGLLVATWTYNTAIWYLKRRASKVPFEKGDPAMDLEVAEEWHDFLLNKVKSERITEKQYNRYCRFLKTLSPDVMWGGPYSTRVRDLLRTQRTKRRIAWNIINQINLPTLGWKIFLKNTREMIAPVKKSRFTRTKV
jgi:hypothetical protein